MAEELAPKVFTRPYAYYLRLNRYVAIVEYLTEVDRVHGLEKIILPIAMRDFAATMSQLGAIFPPDQQDLSEKVRQSVEQQKKDEVKSYLPILYNQTIIMTCAVFEAFLTDCISVLINNNQEALKVLADIKDVNVFDLINQGDLNKSLGQVRERVMNKFSACNIHDKLSKFTNLGIDINQVKRLEGSKESVKESYNRETEFFGTIFQRRNDIVHRNFLPFSDITEVARIDKYFLHFMVNLTAGIFRKYGINADIYLMAKHPSVLQDM